MITFENVTVKFGDFTAIPDFTLTINKGEFFTFLGPSGCGKSTALRTLAGFIEPAGGRLVVDGKDVTTLPSDKRGVGMVFQNYALFPSLSVRENIAFGLRVAKRPAPEIRDRVEAIAAEVELTPAQLDKGVADLSGGQQQRVAIARALVLRPRILLLDEPLSNLDAKLRAQLRVQLKDLQQQFGITTIYVTHDQDEALSMSDRIAVLNHGRIEQVGTPSEIYESSASEFVCTFVGAVNRLGDDLVGELAREFPGAIDAEKVSFIRVERIAVNPDAATAGLLRLRGVVESSTYHGDSTLYRVAVAGQVLRVSVAALGSGAPLQPGDSVELGMSAADVLQYQRATSS